MPLPESKQEPRSGGLQAGTLFSRHCPPKGGLYVPRVGQVGGP